MNILISIIFSFFLSYVGYWKQSLSATGAFAAFGVGIASCLAGWPHAATLFFFFVSSSAMTKVGQRKKRQIEAGEAWFLGFARGLNCRYRFQRRRK